MTSDSIAITGGGYIQVDKEFTAASGVVCASRSGDGQRRGWDCGSRGL